MQPYGDNFILVIPVDFLLHEPDRPFYYDMTCGCKRDERLLWEVSRYIEEGLMTLGEGQAFVAGRTVYNAKLSHPQESDSRTHPNPPRRTFDQSPS